MSVEKPVERHDEPEVEVPEQETPSVELVETMQEGRETLMETLQLSVSNTHIKDYTDPIGRSAHGHAPNKHDVRSAFNVNPNIFRNEFDLSFIPNGHEVLWYMVENKEKLIESDTPVFVDTDCNDESRWQQIESTRDVAPIRPECEARIRAEA